MNCPSCNTETISEALDYQCNNRIIGDVIVPQVEVEQCPNCDERILSEEAETAVSHYLKTREKEAIASLPAEDLISAGQAAAILGVTKQAFSKNPKIKKGLVYFVSVGTKKFFFRTSVTLYKTVGDGRFPITQWKSSMDSGRIASCDTADSGWQQISSSIETADDGVYIWNTSALAIS
ncbi:MAG: hypothetical protein ACR2PB_07425 [Desulfocapsaceae bacterium]